MPKVRVYELAKELGVESKTVLSMLKDMGEFVRSASSTVEAPVERRLKEKLASEPPPAKKIRHETRPRPQRPLADYGSNGRGHGRLVDAAPAAGTRPKAGPHGATRWRGRAAPASAPLQSPSATPAPAAACRRRRRPDRVPLANRQRLAPGGRRHEQVSTAAYRRSRAQSSAPVRSRPPRPGEPVGQPGPRPRPGSTGGLPGLARAGRASYRRATPRQQSLLLVAGHGHVPCAASDRQTRPAPAPRVRRPVRAPAPGGASRCVPGMPRPNPAMMPKQSSGQLGAPAGPGARGRGAPPAVVAAGPGALPVVAVPVAVPAVRRPVVAAVAAVVAAPKVRSVAPVVRPAVVASRSGSVVKSSTRCRPRRSVAYASARVTGRPSGSPAAPR